MISLKLLYFYEDIIIIEWKLEGSMQFTFQVAKPIQPQLLYSENLT